MRPGRTLRSCSGHPQRPPGAQAQDQLTLERSTPFDIQRQVDRFMADPHRQVVGVVDLQTLGDSLRAPRLHPSAISAMGLVPAGPRGRAGRGRSHLLWRVGSVSVRGSGRCGRDCRGADAEHCADQGNGDAPFGFVGEPPSFSECWVRQSVGRPCVEQHPSRGVA